MKHLKELIQVVLVGGYLIMAALTGASREQECAPDGVFPKKATRELLPVSAVYGAFWPYTLYQHYQTGSTKPFFRRGNFCNVL